VLLNRTEELRGVLQLAIEFGEEAIHALQEFQREVVGSPRQSRKRCDQRWGRLPGALDVGSAPSMILGRGRWPFQFLEFELGMRGVTRTVGILGTGIYYTLRSGHYTGAHYQPGRRPGRAAVAADPVGRCAEGAGCGVGVGEVNKQTQAQAYLARLARGIRRQMRSFHCARMCPFYPGA
jgi:hypothetical protein